MPRLQLSMRRSSVAPPSPLACIVAGEGTATVALCPENDVLEQGAASAPVVGSGVARIDPTLERVRRRRLAGKHYKKVERSVMRSLHQDV